MRNWVSDGLNEHFQQVLDALVEHQVPATVWWRGGHKVCMTADRVVVVNTEMT
jgi:hypothetical protein